MKFNTDKCYSSLEADTVELMQFGYFSNKISHLKSAVEKGDSNFYTVYSRLDGIASEEHEHRFLCAQGSFALFYPAQKISQRRYARRNGNFN